MVVQTRDHMIPPPLFPMAEFFVMAQVMELIPSFIEDWHAFSLHAEAVALQLDMSLAVESDRRRKGVNDEYPRGGSLTSRA